MPEQQEVKVMEILKEFVLEIQKNLEKVSETIRSPLPKGIVPMVDIIKPGKCGDAKIVHYRVTAQGAMAHNIALANEGSPEMAIVPGRYVRLSVNNVLMMTDTPHESKSNRDLIEGARGDVLIAGLGIGMVLVPILLKKNVKSVTVIEKSDGVVTMVREQILQWRDQQSIIGAKPAPLEIIKADIFTWEPYKRKYDVIYFDIWPVIGKTILDEGKILKKKYKANLKPKGWMGVWAEKQARAFHKKQMKLDEMILDIKKERLAKRNATNE